MEQWDKTAIILVVGSMRSAHGAGFLYALEKEMALPKPDIMIGSSGNAANVLYHCADQIEEMRRIWLQLLSTPRFISIWRFWRIMNIDYLVDTVFKHQEPLDVKQVQSTPIEWCIPLTDYDTGKTLYVSAGDDFDPFELLRGAKAIPILFGKKVRTGHRQYIDGEFGATLQDHVSHALALGARRIVIVNHFSGWNWPR